MIKNNRKNILKHANKITFSKHAKIVVCSECNLRHLKTIYGI